MTAELIENTQCNETENNGYKVVSYKPKLTSAESASECATSDNPTFDTTRDEAGEPEVEGFDLFPEFHHKAELSPNQKRKASSEIKKVAEYFSQSLDEENRVENGNRFNSQLVNAQNIGARYHDVLHDTVAAVYEPAHMYYNGDRKQCDVYRQHLQNLLGQPRDATQKSKGSPYHDMVKLVFGDDRRYASYIAHVIQVALGQAVDPKNFKSWLAREGGLKSITVKYDRNGKIKSQKTNGAATSGDTINVQVHRAREHLKALNLVTFSKQDIGSALDDLKTGTELSAIVMRCADGSFVVKAIVDDDVALNAVYSGYYKANTEQFETDSAAKSAT